MKKTVIFLMLLTIFSKILGFARDISLSYFYGATIISDVYLIASTIPFVILAIIGKGISTGFVPMYTRIESNEGTERAINYTNNLVNFVMVVCTIILIMGLLFTEQIVKLFASGFDGETLDLAVVFTRISLIGVYFTGLNYVFAAFLQVKGIFIITALVGLPSNFIVIGSFFLGSQTNVYMLAVGSVLAIGSQFLLIVFYGYKNNYRYKPRLDVKDKNIKQLIILALPVILGSSVAQINLLIDRTLASKISLGGISALNYANTINLIVLGVVVSTITTVLYPKIAKMAVQSKMNELKTYISEAINTIHLFVLPVTVGYMLFAEPIVQLLYGRGEFDSKAISLTSIALFYYSIGLIGFSLRDILSNVFYSLQDTKTPMVNAAISMLINIVLNFVLSKYLGIGGLALATSISILFCSLLLLINLRKKIGNFGLKTIMLTFTKIFFASLAMGGISHHAYNLLINQIGSTFSLFLSVLIGMIVYATMISFMKIKEVNSLIISIKHKSKSSTNAKAAS
ncbi:murein biosynthesis integral membrane protein MurJ [Neobacillus sp. K501]